MSTQNLLDFPDDFTLDDFRVESSENLIRISFRELKTNWIDENDPFIKRIRFENLNPDLIERHLLKEIEIKNRLDESQSLISNGKFKRSIEILDEILFYDESYCEALIYKSRALFGQKHYVKSLRHYKRAVRCNDDLKDVEYHKLLLKKANDERDAFPKIKRYIYAGDEYLSKGDFEKAIESYNHALENPSKFTDKILFKLLNKKATALFKLNQYEKSLDCFGESLSVKKSGYAHFMKGLCQYSLGENPTESLKMAKGIDKKSLLEKSRILCEVGEVKLARECIDYLSANHFKRDGIYEKITEIKKSLDVIDNESE